MRNSSSKNTWCFKLPVSLLKVYKCKPAIEISSSKHIPLNKFSQKTVSSKLTNKEMLRLFPWFARSWLDCFGLFQECCWLFEHQLLAEAWRILLISHHFDFEWQKVFDFQTSICLDNRFDQSSGLKKRSQRYEIRFQLIFEKPISVRWYLHR